MSSRGMPVTKRMREERRARADKAHEEYNKLTLDQKLARLPADGAKRQRARLEALKLASVAKASVKAEETVESTEEAPSKKAKKGKKQS